MPQLQPSPGPVQGRAFAWARQWANAEGIADQDARTVRLPRRAAEYARQEGVQEGTISARLSQLDHAGVLRSRKPIVLDIEVCDAASSGTVVAFPTVGAAAALTSTEVIIQLIAREIASNPSSPQVAGLAEHLLFLAGLRDDRAEPASEPRGIADFPRAARLSSLDQTDQEAGSVEDNSLLGTTIQSVRSSEPRTARGQLARDPARGNAELEKLLTDAHTDWDLVTLERWIDSIAKAGAAHGLSPRPQPIEPLVRAMTKWTYEVCDFAVARLAHQLSEADAHGIRNPWAVLVDIFTNGNDGYIPATADTPSSSCDWLDSPAPPAVREPVDFDSLIAADVRADAEAAATAEILAWEADPATHQSDLDALDEILANLTDEAPALAATLRHLPPHHQRAVVLARQRAKEQN